MSGTLPLIVAAVGGVFLTVAAGAGARAAGWLTPAASDSLLRLSINLLFPCFVLDVLVGNPALADPLDALAPPAVGFATTVLGFAVGGLVARALGPRIGLRTPAARRTFALIVGMYNYGYTPIPIVEALFPGEPTLGVLLVHNVGVDLALWSVGVTVVSGGFAPGWWRRPLNAPLLAIVVALAVNATGADAWLLRDAGDIGGAVAGVITGALGLIGATAIPLALLLVGGSVLDAARSTPLLRDPLVPLTGAVLRLGVLPLCFVALTWLLPLGVHLDRVVRVEAAMPAALFPILLARVYGGDPAVAVRVALFTTVLGLVTIPLWLTLLL